MPPRKKKEYNKAYDCRYCKFMELGEHVWNPYKASGGTCVDPQRSLAAHEGICSFRPKAEKKAKRILEQKSREEQVIPHQEHDGHMPLIHYESKRPRNNLDNADMLQDIDFILADDPLRAGLTQCTTSSSSSSLSSSTAQQDHTRHSSRYNGVDNAEMLQDIDFILPGDPMLAELTQCTSSSSSSSPAQQDSGRNDNAFTCLMLEGDVEIASNVAYEQQQKLVDAYTKIYIERELNVRASPGYSEDSKLSIVDIIDIAKWLEQSTISLEDGDSLFKLINVILERHNLHHMLHFPAQTETIIKCVANNADKLHRIIDIEIPFPEEQWGTKMHDDKTDIPTVKASRFPFCDVLAELALTMSPETVKWEATEHEKEDGKIHDIFTAEFGRHTSAIIDEVNAKDENNKINGKRIKHVLLYMSLTQDDTNLSRNGVNGCPVLLEIKNWKAPPILLGLQPVLPLTNATLATIQMKMGCVHKGAQKEQIRSLKRYMRARYVEEAVTDIRRYHKSGLLLQIGSNPEDLVIVHPIICNLTGDSKELYDMCSINWMMRGCKCRICTEKNCLRFSEDLKTWKPRNAERMFELCRELDRIEKDIHKKLCESGAKTKRKDWYSEEDIQYIKEARQYNLIPSSCPVYFNLGLDINKIWGVPNFDGLSSMPAMDMLHTYLKGVLENGICWTMSILYLLQDINSREYGNIVSNIDSIFHNFPCKHSVTPVLLPYQEYGISRLMTDAKSKKQSAVSGTGTGVGGTPASHLPGIGFMLLHAIGSTGGAASHGSMSQIPETIKISTNHSNSSDKSKWMPRKDYKIRTILVNTLQALLNTLTFARKADGFSKDNLLELEKLIRLTRAHLVQLFSVKSDLKQMSLGVPIKNRVDKMFSGVKHHLLEHLCEFISRYGPPSFFDTQDSEHFHMFIKLLYQLTSRRKKKATREIFERLSRNRRLDFLARAFTSTTTVPNPSPEPLNEEQHRHHLHEKKTKELQNLIDDLEERKKKSIRHLERSLERLRVDKQNRKQREHEVRQQLCKRQVNVLLQDDNIQQAVIALNHRLEASTDSLYSSFFIPSNTSKGVIEVDRGSFSSREQLSAQNGKFIDNKSVQYLLHPFVNWTQLFTYLNLKIPDGLSRLFFQGHKEDSVFFKVKLNEMLSSKGKPDEGIEPFVIHCNSKTNNFSAIEVSYQGDKTEVVRVFAIITLHQMKLTNSAKEHSVRTVLVCGRLREISRRGRTDSIHCPILEYDILRNTSVLEVDVIDLTSIVRPAMLMPIFTKDFRPEYAEKSTDLTVSRSAPNFYGKRQFHLVPSPTMHYFKAVNFNLIDEIIDLKDRAKQTDRNETTHATQQRLLLGKNFIAHRLFLTEEELRLTEISNNIDVLGEDEVAKKSNSEILESEMRDMYDDEEKDESDIDDDDIVLS